MSLFIAQLFQKIKNIKFTQLLIVIVIIVISFFFLFHDLLKKGSKKSKATGESVTVIFDPSSLSGEETAELTPLKIKGKPTIDMRVRGYEIIVTFDNAHLEVKEIAYPANCPSVSGYSSTIDQANNSGTIKIACANTTTEGFILSSSSTTELVQLIFKSKKAASSTIVITPNNIGFSMITSSGLSTIPSSSNNPITAQVITGVVTNTPTLPSANTPTVPLFTPSPTSPSTPTPTQSSSTCNKKGEGDANCDGVINGVDYSMWLNRQCNSGCAAENLKADFNSDNKVNDDDYSIWFNHRQ